MKTRGTIAFTDDHEIFYICMVEGGDVKTVASILRGFKHLLGWDKWSGEVAAEFVMKHRSKVGTTRLATPSTEYFRLFGPNFTYNVSTRKATIFVTTGSNETVVYSGTIEKFCKWEWTNASYELQSAVDKVVKFTYNGGSGKGERLVKLTGVEGIGNQTILRGWDIKHSTPDEPAYRTYRISNIVGNVEVLG